MGASLGQKPPAGDLHSGLDLGPQEKPPPPAVGDGLCCLENASKPQQPLGLRSAEAGGRGWCFLVAGDMEASGTRFRIETGLLGRGCSIRCLQQPLEYVRVQHEHFVVSQYDGTQLFRNEATFDLRRGELEKGDSDASWMCLMLAQRPGLYAHMEKDGQIVVKPYSYLDREAFHFKVLPVETTTSTALLWDVAEPSIGGPGSSTSPERSESSTAKSSWLKPSSLKSKFSPTFSLPDVHDVQQLYGLQLPQAEVPAVCDDFEKVD